MRRLVAWATANPISTISAALLPVCIAVMVYIAMSGSSFRDEASKKVQGDLNRLRGLASSHVDVPSDDPDNPMTSIALCITQSSIKQLSRIRDEMDGEYQAIFNYAVKRNQQGLNYAHVPMVEGLFPLQRDEGLLFEAQDAYRQTLAEFVMPRRPEAQVPRLNGGRPLSPRKIDDELQRVQGEYSRRSRVGNQGDEALQQVDQQELNDEMHHRLIGLLHEHAKQFQIYAYAPEAEDPNRPDESIESPFFLGEWLLSANKPTLEQLWEGQLDLWIQQDIVEAIAMTNQGAENVLAAPVKRLVRVQVEPGYVGSNSQGAVRGFEPMRQDGTQGLGGLGRRGLGPRGMRFHGDPTAMQRPGLRGGMGGPSGDGGTQEGYDDEFLDGEDPESQNIKTNKIEEDYELTPTGRQSNVLYDVRHAVVTLIVDSKRVGQFLDNLSKVNFMTVLLLTVDDVDEYEHMRGTDEGHFVYGPHDAVQLTLVIESLWLRRWTSGHSDLDEAKRLRETYDPGLMPDDVRALLKMNRRVPRGPTRPPRPTEGDY